ncbi:MAG TPA: trypsin-like peptidase domain-containing protein, partial [Candidatus Solibacter sp.]|nr:trypsin-like peptidase domain-containing protein [Candidatus Solibacter sp.]
HFTNFRAGAGEVWVFAAGDEFAFAPYTGSGPNRDGEFWAAAVDSDTAIIAFTAPAGQTPAHPPFTVDALVHEWSATAPATDAASCEVDAACVPEYQTAATAVVRYTFIRDADSGLYACSGAMVNTAGKSLKPYMLTAHHCIGSDSEAKTIEARFLYQTASCNGAPPKDSASSLPTVLGGSYLACDAIANGDWALLLLPSVPGGVAFLNWNVALDSGASVTGIHHPQGSYTRISQGRRTADVGIAIGSETGPAGDYYQVAWTTGIIEPGSSGSPLLNASQEIVGTLTGGPAIAAGASACGVQSTAFYGRFTNAFPVIKPYLQDAPPATVSADTASLKFQVIDGVVADPTEQKIGLTTLSATPLGYTAQANRPWIKVPSPGTVSAGSPASLAVSIDPAGLTAAGNYAGSITATLATGGSVSIPVVATIVVSRSNVAVLVSPNPVNQVTDPSGPVWIFTVTVRETAGLNTRITGFKVDATDLTASVQSAYGANLAAASSFSTSIRSAGATVPSTHTVEVDGVDDATGYAWKQIVPVQFAGPATQAVLTLISTPDPIREDDAAPANCTWKQQFILSESGGFAVQLNRLAVGGFDQTANIPIIFGSTNLAARQAVKSGAICWPNYILTPPVGMVVELDGTDSAGNAIAARTNANFFGPLPDLTPLHLFPGVVSLGAASGGAPKFTAAVAIDAGGSNAAWTATINAVSWLTGAPASGSGNGTFTLTVNPAGLANGTYTSSVVVQAADGTQIQTIPVYLQVGPPPAAPSIGDGGFLNGASFKTTMAPGSLISIFGSNLATSGGSATAVPLPLYGNSTSVTIDGYAAPLKDIFPTQLNVQVPWEVNPGTVQVTVNVAGRTDTKPMQVVPVAPGIFVDGGGRLVPLSTGHRGDYMILFITGQGAVSPTVPTGAGPSAGTALSQLPVPVQPVQVTIGDVTAPILFAGIPAGLVGVTQINFQIPANAPLGDQPL